MKQIALLLFSVLSFASIGQNYRFNHYTTENGLAQDFIYSISQDKNGYLWIGTGEGLCRFDGKTFKTSTTKDGLSENIITCSYYADNNVAWFGHNEGTITKFDKGKFQAFSSPKIAQSTVTGVCGSEEQIFFTTQNEGVFTIVNNKIQLLGKYGGESFHSIGFLDSKNLIVGTSEGLYHLTKKENGWIKKAVYFNENWISSITNGNKKDIYIIGLQNGIIAEVNIEKGSLIVRKLKTVSLADVSVKMVLQDSRNNFWVGTMGAGLAKIHINVTGEPTGEVTWYNTQTGLASDYIQTIFQDREENIWIGTFGMGLSSLIDDYFTFYKHTINGEQNNLNAIWVDNENKWFGMDNGIIRVSNTSPEMQEFYTDTSGFIDDRVTSIYQTNHTLWVGTASNGVYKYNTDQNKFEKIAWNFGRLHNKVNQITGDSANLWIATQGGLIVYDQKQENSFWLGTQDGLGHNAIQSVLKTRKGTLFIGTYSRYLYHLVNSSIKQYEVTRSGELEIIALAEDDDENIWLATAESGVFKFDGNDFTYFSTQNGLKSNYTYAINIDANGDIWVGHQGALSKISKNGDKITIYDHTTGVKGRVNKKAMHLDPQNFLWIGTEGGAIRYDAAKDVENTIPPVINLLKIWIGDKAYSPGEDIILPYGDYRIQFEYIGVSFKNPDKIIYRHKLEGYDAIYSNYTKETVITYGKISDGEYTFKMLACNENDVCTEKPAEFNIIIKSPFWKKTWFYIVVLLFLVGIFILIDNYRTKRLKRIQTYLKEQLDIKTKEVVEKADKIEEINKDLMDSINYAEGIQKSILPDVKLLQQEFPGSFIFFRPRDIVSGDFYFLQKINNKLIVACVDCTGHGVPGAFVSMIGSVILKNIYSQSKWEWKTPEKVLEKLDNEVKVILQQKSNSENHNDSTNSLSKDGMDLTLCEINLETKEVLLASARQTSLLQINNEIIVHKGDSRSIGEENIRKIPFSLHRFQLKPNDALYIFTDGYTDQFGGPDGKKLKSSGTKSIVEGLIHLKREEYGMRVESDFESWKAGLDQIDDVLFIGILV